jgi:hypothetical protein
MSANEHIVIGERNELRRQVPFGLSPADRRQHLYIIGKSGTGKTTLLRNLIIQDIYAGRAVGVIDPHGDLAEEILAHMPSHRAEDVVYFDPSDSEYCISFNPIFNVPPDKRHLVCSGIVAAFRDLFPAFWGPRMEYIFSAAVAAVLECQNVSLLSVQRMLSDAAYRNWIVKQVKDPMVRSFWEDEFENYDKKFLSEAVAPIQNKLGQVLLSPHLRNIFGQVKGRIDARFMMDNGRIFIANLSKGKLGADKSNLVGALLVSHFQIAAMSRADLPEDARHDFNLYIDEFHSFGSDSFAAILSEARKYRLSLTLAHQYLSQVSPRVLDAIIGNVGSVVAFRVGHHDAETLQKALGGGFRAEDFTSLNNREVYAKLLAYGKDIPPFQGVVPPPLGTRFCRGSTIVRRSRERYSRLRVSVEAKISKWLGLSQTKRRG